LPAAVGFCAAHRQQPGLRGIVALPIARHRPVQQDREADDSSTTTICKVLARLKAFSFKRTARPGLLVFWTFLAAKSPFEANCVFLQIRNNTQVY
jgi:hypothetical protein